MEFCRDHLHRLAQHKDVLALLLLVAIINFWTMPREAYPGDACAIRLESTFLLEQGHLGIPAENNEFLREAVAAQGQYFFFHPQDSRMYSKWGILNTALFLPPLVAERLLFKVDDPFDSKNSLSCDLMYSKNRIFLLNIYNLFFTLLVAVYLYRLAGLFSEKIISRYVFVLGILYSTILWNYLRAQSSEIFQILFFTMFFFYLVRFQRDESRLDLLACGICAGLLSLIKTYYLLIFPILAFLLLLHGRNKGKRLALNLGIPAAVTLGIILFFNHLKFGSCLESGYGQWKVNGTPHDEFSIATIPEALAGYLFGPNSSMFTHFPILIVALFGFYLFQKKYSNVFLFVWSFFLPFLVLFSCFSNWSGAWCYGPRYLLFILPIASLPFLSVSDFLLQRIKAWPAIACALSIGCLFLYSLQLQINVNTGNFFLPQRLSSMYSLLKDPKINAYFQRHWGLIMGDFLAQANERGSFYPLERLKQILPPDQGIVLQESKDLHSPAKFERNYYFSEPGK